MMIGSAPRAVANRLPGNQLWKPRSLPLAVLIQNNSKA
jgi:hypothetical protein